MKLKICLLGLLCLFLRLNAQPVIPPGGLKVGDKIPDFTISHILNYPGGTAKISDFNHKLLILDFWATWCSSCMDGLAKNPSLAGKFPDDLVILPVNNEDISKVRSAYHSNMILKAVNPVSVTEDVIFNKLFPHAYLPHLVWVKDGRYIGATAGDYLTAKTIAAVLKGDYKSLDQKNDIASFEPKNALFPVGGNKQLANYQPMITSSIGPYLNGVPLKAGIVKDKITKQTRLYYINHSILHLYTLALNSGLAITPNRTVLEVQDRERYQMPDTAFQQRWQAGNCYTYEVTADSSFSVESLKARMKSDLDNTFGLFGREELRDVPAYVLTLTDSSMLVSKYARTDVRLNPLAPQKYLHHIRTADIIFQLNQVSKDVPALDESGTSRFFDLDLPEVPASVSEWETVLKSAGLNITKTHRTLPVFVLSEAHRPGSDFYSQK